MSVIHASTKFSPVKNGFPFVNYFQPRFPVNYSVPLLGTIDLNKMVFGLCGGMCYAALDYYYGETAVTTCRDVAKIDRPLYDYLCERQLESLSVPVLIKLIEYLLSEDSAIATKIARNEAPRLRKLLDSGQPAVLVLIRSQGLGELTSNHQVLAIGYDFDSEKKEMTIYLYDPNHPGEDPSIQLNLSKPSSGLGLAQSTREPLRGFFVSPYKTSATYPKTETLAPEGLAFDVSPIVETFRLQWPVDSRRVNQYFGENPLNYQGFGLPGHEGLDLYAPDRANVYAAADGVIYQAGHPNNHPYGLHVRIRHEFGGNVYQTIYGHLCQTFVQIDQKVKAGDLIGLADNTGNSFGSHLHLTLKIEGAKTPGYPPGIVDPWPYLQDAKPLPSPSGVLVYTNGQVNLRAEPDSNSRLRGILASGEALNTLGEAQEIRAAVGKEGKWVEVQTASGQVGNVAAWLVQTDEQSFLPGDLVVYPFESLNLRAGPGSAFTVIDNIPTNVALTVLGDAAAARAKLGVNGQWLQVQTEKGQKGFVAAWFVRTTGQVLPTAGVIVTPSVALNIRARPATDANIMVVAEPGDRLNLLGDKDVEFAKLGQEGQWANVETSGHLSGYAAAWFLQPAVSGMPEEPQGNVLLVYPLEDLNLRAQPSVNAPRLDGANQNQPLRVLDAQPSDAKAKIGKADTWLFVQKDDGTRGWVAAWFLSDRSSA